MEEKNKKSGPISGDPSEIHPLIVKQKNKVKSNPKNPHEWLKLGLLHEQQVAGVKAIAQKSSFVRFGILLIIPIFLCAYCTLFYSQIKLVLSMHPLFFFLVSAVLVFFLLLIFKIRFPPTGKKYFIKVIKLDPSCAEAYMHLGLIALRHYQKRKAYNYLEKALWLSVNDKQIKQHLKTHYQKEFIGFFNMLRQEQKKKQNMVESQKEQIEKLKACNFILQTNVSILTAKAKQVKSNANRSSKIKVKELTDRFEEEKRRYQMTINQLKYKNSELIKYHENNQIIHVNLGDQVFLKDLNLEALSYQNGSKPVEFSLELDLWQSLSKRTRFYLVTAEQTLQALTQVSGPSDFSLVGLEWCKALEVEINNRFIQPFISYLGNKKEELLHLDTIGTRKQKPKYYSYLSMVIDDTHYPNVTTLTLGQFHFLFKQSLNNEFSLQLYKMYLDDLFGERSPMIQQVFLKKLAIVTKEYRNVIAHGSSLDLNQCFHLRELIFEEKDSLFQILANINQPKMTTTISNMAAPVS